MDLLFFWYVLLLQSTFIQRTIHASRLSTFRRRLSEGSVISLVDLRSHRATLIFHSLTPQSPFVSTMESFAETTDSKKDIPTELFRLRSHEHLLAVANTKKKVKAKAVANTKKKVKAKKLRKIRIGWTVVGLSLYWTRNSLWKPCLFAMISCRWDHRTQTIMEEEEV
ncbi:hypothetical protein Bca4012_009230 [Brassica carinata]